MGFGKITWFRLASATFLAGGVLLTTSFGVVTPKSSYTNFNDLVFDRIQEYCDVGGILNDPYISLGEDADVWPTLPAGTYAYKDLYPVEGFCHDDQALVHESDADALAVVLRRTEALLNHLKVMPGAPDLSTYEQEFNALKTRSADVDPSNRAGRKDLFTQVRAVRRKIAFSNPLLSDIDKLLFVEYDPIWGNGIHMCDQYYGCNVINGGGLYVLEDPFGPNPQRRELLTGPVESGAYAGTDLRTGAFLSPEVSYDGNTIYFAWCEGNNPFKCKDWTQENTWHIFKVNADGTGLIQLTEGEGGMYWNEFDPCVLPGGRVVFISERRTGDMLTFGRCHGGRKVPAYTLFSMKPDGSDKYPIAYHETNQWHPSVDNNGMLVFTQWDYVDRGSNEAHHIWTCYPDGRDPRAPHGNYDHPWGDRNTPYDKMPETNLAHNAMLNPGKGGSNLHPWGEWNIRAIPGSHKYIATAAPHHGVAYGSLVTINTRKEDDGMMAQVRRVTPDCPFPEAEFERPFFFQDYKDLPNGWHFRLKDYYRSARYATAWPLSEDFYICNYWKHIILLDRFGNKEVLYRLDWDNPEDYRLGFRPIDPMPLGPRDKPPALAQKTFDGEDAPTDHPRATISVQNIYVTYPVDWPDGVVEQKKIKWMRIVQFIPKTTPGENQPRVGDYDMATCRMSLGIVPVENDGSVYCNAPINRPIYFQALDENQMAIQSMKALTYVHSGEQLSCVGCHESKWESPPPLQGTPMAFKRDPSPIQEEFPGHHTDPTKGAIPFNYHLLAKPALQRAGYGGEYQCYWAPQNRGSRSIPGYVGTRQSSIGDDLLQKYTSGSISEEDFHRIVMWIDLNSNELGWDHDVEAQQAGQVVWPEIDVDRDNLVGTEHWLPPPDTVTVATRFHKPGDRSSPEPVDRDAAVEIHRRGASLVIVNLSPGRVPVRLWDARGKVVFDRTYTVSSQSVEVPLTRLAPGMYVCRVKVDQGILTRAVSTVR